ncbi:MAG: DUF2520 domain-containing protein [Raineya sp.]|jgi:predicted short-subunit dehydrogenase-like oxidoreductase (DUF2520 family)|nr:DUF2520 domain-containing protein [Raineya sp.]
MKVAFVGAGNVAWHLAQAFENTHIAITEVYSRDIAHAELLCNKLTNATIKNDYNFTDSEADILLVSVSDDAISSVISQIQIPTKVIIAHTSGSVSMDVFKNKFENCGVFYPLQTFSKEKKLSIHKVPFCIEGANSFVTDTLKNLALKISQLVYDVNSEQRKTLHVGAIFACNFVNHLLALSKEILTNKSLDFNILKPLIEETIEKALSIEHPKDVQTGPAIRKDIKTIEKHLSYLNFDLSKQKIYQLLTESIMNFYADKSE